jgi:hypothetical protein
MQACPHMGYGCASHVELVISSMKSCMRLLVLACCISPALALARRSVVTGLRCLCISMVPVMRIYLCSQCNKNILGI